MLLVEYEPSSIMKQKTKPKDGLTSQKLSKKSNSLYTRSSYQTELNALFCILIRINVSIKGRSSSGIVFDTMSIDKAFSDAVFSS